MPKNLNQLRKGKEFVDYAEKKGAEIRRGKGSHVVVRYKGESFIIPEHNKDLGVGLRAKIIKWFIAVGLGLLVLIVYYHNYFDKLSNFGFSKRKLNLNHYIHRVHFAG